MYQKDTIWSRIKMRWRCLTSSGEYVFDGRKQTDPTALRALIGAEELFKLALKRVAKNRPDGRVSSKLPVDREGVRAEVDRLTEYLTAVGVMTLL